MTTDESRALAEITKMAVLWRYDHPGEAEIDRDQQMVDGLALLRILQRNNIAWEHEFAMKIIPAPGKTRKESHEPLVAGQPVRDQRLRRVVHAPADAV